MNKEELENKIIIQIDLFRNGMIDHYDNLKDNLIEIINEHFKELNTEQQSSN